MAGLFKLGRRSRFGQTVVDFGIPALIASQIAFVVPLIELATAVALLIPASARWGALGSSALLTAFTIAIAVSLIRGNKPECQCFGQLHSTPIGSPALVRNGVLLAMAGLVASKGPGNFGFSTSDWWALSLVATATVLSIVIIGILRQQGRLLIRIESLESALGIRSTEPEPANRPPGLSVGNAAPEFSLHAPDSTVLTLSSLRVAGHPVLLVFTSPHCSPCRALVPEIAAWQRRHADRLTVAVIGEKPTDQAFAEAAEHELTLVGIQDNREVADAYHCAATPGAVLVSPAGLIASPLAMGTGPIRSLVAGLAGTDVPIALGTAASSPALPIGSPAPPFALPRLGGGIVSLSDCHQSPTLIVFWDAGCSFCRQMAPQLKALEAEPPSTHHQLVVVVTGSATGDAEIGFTSPVALDAHHEAMAAFGIHGTPMAVLVDENGAIASAVAAGEQAVLALGRRVRVDVDKAVRP
ncbi:MAG: redoxin domain-containing protein [Actinomycetota bacterium]|nr:redoxin domain-containing protein [Actinomycetota bacterium]